MEIQDSLESIFSSYLDVGKRHLTIDSLTFNEPSFLICSFNLEFNDELEDSKTYEKMQEINLKLKE